MTDRDAALVERLGEAKNPRNLHDWRRQEGYYVAACRASAEDVPGLIELVRKWTDPSWYSDDEEGQSDDAAALLPVTAWRTLADLKAEAAVEPLVEMLRELEDEFDDRVCEELPHVFGKIGESSIEPLTKLVTDDSQPDFVRSVAARGLQCVVEYHPGTRERIKPCLTDLMANVSEDHLEFNSTLLVVLLDLKAIEAAESIERAFAGNMLDVGMAGPWEDIRRELGVDGLGLKMPENPYNSLAKFGIGMFSAQQQEVFPIVRKERVGRNDPCPCGSGRKFKKCCGGHGH